MAFQRFSHLRILFMETQAYKRSNLDYQRSIWVEEEELGNDKIIIHKKKKIKFRIPQEIEEEVILRFKGLGKTKGNETGNLILHIWLNKGEDIKGHLWLSESSARSGAIKNLLLTQRRIQVLVPKGSSNGLNLRLKGLGKKSVFRWRTPLQSRKNGNLLVELRTYPDYIKPTYRSFYSLSTDALALEGWVYQKKDEIIWKMGKSIKNIKPVKADTIADIFNESGWEAIFNYLKSHFNLGYLSISLEPSDSNSPPGSCIQSATRTGNVISSGYIISINKAFTDNPFTVTAILAHELSHVVYCENFKEITQQSQFNDEKQKLEEERMVDLLLFMFKLGEFQLRVSRDRNITIGYFDQEIFDRIYVIVSRALS